jgi:TPR repeat protein
VKQRITTLFAVSLLALTLVGVAAAGQFEDGKAAAERGDYAEPMQLLRPLADQGDADAQNGLGSLYTFGRGVPQDFAQAYMWYRKAANQGNHKAQNSLGFMYDKGWGVPQDFAQAGSFSGIFKRREALTEYH